MKKERRKVNMIPKKAADASKQKPKKGVTEEQKKILLDKNLCEFSELESMTALKAQSLINAHKSKQTQIISLVAIVLCLVIASFFVYLKSKKPDPNEETAEDAQSEEVEKSDPRMPKPSTIITFPSDKEAEKPPANENEMAKADTLDKTTQNPVTNETPSKPAPEETASLTVAGTVNWTLVSKNTKSPPIIHYIERLPEETVELMLQHVELFHKLRTPAPENEDLAAEIAFLKKCFPPKTVSFHRWEKQIDTNIAWYRLYMKNANNEEFFKAIRNRKPKSVKAYDELMAKMDLVNNENFVEQLDVLTKETEAKIAEIESSLETMESRSAKRRANDSLTWLREGMPIFLKLYKNFVDSYKESLDTEGNLSRWNEFMAANEEKIQLEVVNETITHPLGKENTFSFPVPEEGILFAAIEYKEKTVYFPADKQDLIRFEKLEYINPEEKQEEQ